MKKLALAVALAASFGSAQASGLYIDNASAVTFSGYNGQPASVTGVQTSGLWGALGAFGPGNKVKFTYLGQESGYWDKFKFSFTNSTAQILESDPLGKSISTVVPNLTAAGYLPFYFTDSHGGVFHNGDAQTPVLGFAIMAGQTNKYGKFDYLIGFNDSFNADADYDDFVIGVSSVPLPAALPLMASGLGLLGFAGFRRKSEAA